MADQYLFRFDEEGLDRIIQRVEEFRRTIREVGQAGELGEGFQRFFNQFIAGTRQSTKVLRDLRSQITDLKAQLSSARFTTELEALRGFQFGQKITPQIAGAVPGINVGDVSNIGALRQVQEETERRITEQQQLQNQLADRINAAKAEEARLDQILFAEEQRLGQEKQRQANLAAFNNRIEEQRVRLLSQIRDVRPGGSRLNQLAIERENALLQRQQELWEQLAQEVARFNRTTPRQAQETLGEEVRLSQQLQALTQARIRAERDLATAKKDAAAAGFGQPGRFAGVQTEQERNQLLRQQEQLQARIAAAQEKVRAITLSLAQVEQERARNFERLAVLQGGGDEGARGITEIQNRLREVDQLLAQLAVSGDAVADVFGTDILGEVAQIEQVLASFAGRDVELLTPEEIQELATAQARARELLATIERFPREGIPLRLDEDELGRIPGVLNRILLGAARDFGRRFTATLQFAISGALLFGAQRLLREFFDAAVEVERTFADISSALEFDIEAERGTAEFERQLERVRRQVLQIADDFNALPTEVNQAAFQMVSRFQNVEAAMIATRAQILATRIATIDQSEALRALTAVAEASAFQFQELSRSERELAIANEQIRSLDFATAIQQQFQVPIEDTLEGAAGLVAVFQGLGFSIEETFAVVATTVLKTGQTGQSVTDALGRAFSAFTSKEIRDELLAVANTTEQLFLTPADFFDSGRTAFLKIVDQYADLDQQLQNRIAEIIGQRRETRFVRALLEGASQGELENILDIAADSAGAAENRLAVLLATVQGTIEGISTEFQELAQNLERLGVITPIRLLLGGLELVLKVVNAILTGALDLIEAFNRIRIPFINAGLGDALTTMIALVTAAASLRGIINSIQFVAKAQGATALLDVIRAVLGLNVQGEGGAAVNVAATAGNLLGFSNFTAKVKEADGLVGKFGTTMSTVFLAPFRLIQGVVRGVTTRLYAWNAALIAGNATTIGATTSEIALQVARARTAVINAVLAARALGFTGILARVGPFLSRLAVGLGGVARAAYIALGAATTLSVGFTTLRSIAERIFGDQEGPSGPTATERRNQIKAEAEAAGQSISDAEAAIQQLTERSEELAKSLEEGSNSAFFADAASFGVSVFGPLLDLLGGREAFPGTRENIEREQRQVGLEKAFANAVLLQGRVTQLNAALGRTGDDLAPSLQGAQDLISEVFNALVEIDPVDVDPAALAAAKELLERAGVVLEEEVPDILGEWGEVLTADQISEALNKLSTDIQLGFTTLANARSRLEVLRQNALAGLAQARAGGDPEAIAEQERLLRDIALADLQFFEQERDAQLERASLIEDNRARLLAELQILRQFAVAAANNPNLGPQAVRDAQQAVVDAERAYNRALQEEAIARLQFQADNARTFRDRIAALQALYAAVLAQIEQRKRETADALVPEIGGGIIGNFIEAALQGAIIASGVIQNTAAEDAQLQAILDTIADEQLRYAQLVARNSTLKNKSALDNIAAIAATANALRAEISLLKQRNADEQEILAKEIELREAVANQRLAESDRRAAFFRLTAGTGDEIKAAQAELRAAIDRLDTIEKAGGADTQAGYEAELAVLQARQRLADLALRLADARRRANSDITDTFEQALLDVQAAQEALRAARGEIEKLEAEISLREAESRAQQEFYDRRLSDLDFLFQTDQIGRSQYISALRALQAGIDRTTRQGEELWRDIELQIRGLQEDASQAFNIPTEIRLPTLFEVRRALAADALGVNYMDQRQQEINIFVSDEVDVNAVIAAIDSAFGSSIDLEAQRLASGGAGITIGGFN